MFAVFSSGSQLIVEISEIDRKYGKIGFECVALLKTHLISIQLSIRKTFHYISKNDEPVGSEFEAVIFSHEVIRYLRHHAIQRFLNRGGIRRISHHTDPKIEASPQF